MAVCTAAGFWVRFANLGDNNFQNDEFYHIEAGVGYLKTGEFVLWDFLKEQPYQEYKRAWIYTWQVAQSIRVFGENEFAARLPSVIWGTALLPLLALFGWKATGYRLVGVFAVLLATFDQSLIWSSRISRMYSMFVFLVILSVFLVFQALHKRYKKFFLHPGWYMGAILGVILSYLTHETGLALAAGMFGSMVWFAIDGSVRNTPEKKMWWLGVCGMLGVGILAVLAHTFVKPFLPTEFFTFRLHPNWEYALYPFNQMRFAFLGWPLLGVAVWAAIRYRSQGIVLLLSNALPILAFFVFIGDRYAAKKYELFIIPLLLICVSYGIDRGLRVGIPKLVGRLPEWLILSITVLAFAVIGPHISWPGVPATAITQAARADASTDTADIHDFRAAYAAVEARVSDDSHTVLIQGNHPYYWTRKDIDFINLRTNKEFTKDEFKKIHETTPHGFVIVPKYKDYHIRYSVMEYIRRHMKRVPGTKKTNVEVYQW